MSVLLVYTLVKVKFCTILKPLYEELIVKNKSRFNTSDASLKHAIDFIEEKADDLRSLPGEIVDTDKTFLKFIKPLLDMEAVSKTSDRPWKFVLDFPSEAGRYSAPPTFQICSGAPDYQRIVMKFNPERMEVRFEFDCIDSNPDLSRIKGSENQDLAQTKRFLDRIQVQRLAILGSARVFAHRAVSTEPTEKNKWAQKYTHHVQHQMNQVLDVMADCGSNYLIVNGGWAGKLEGSTGVPLMSHLFGVISHKKGQLNLRPITVMPKCGAYDRVPTPLDGYYFEVEEEWGDDSKYLVGLSTSLIVFEPYGYWTNIEISNGVAQNKPVAIIADPEAITNAEPNSKYFELKNGTASYFDESIKLPGGEVGHYRVYRNAGAAAAWINELSLEYFDRIRAEHSRLTGPGRFSGSIFSGTGQYQPLAEPTATTTTPATTELSTTRDRSFVEGDEDTLSKGHKDSLDPSDENVDDHDSSTTPSQRT